VELDIQNVASPEDFAQIWILFSEFIQLLNDLGLDIGYQGIQKELGNLPGPYGPPLGCLVFAREAGQIAGCVAIRPICERICELKRMYVCPAFRGQGLGKAIAVHLIEEAWKIGYQTIRLDATTFLSAARGLYRSLGFREIEPYSDLPEEIRKIAVFMELEINSRVE
jgi:GNAT superfamily N-acetyltransferase